jgi:DNA-binding XRE family transcriptional regulator
MQFAVVDDFRRRRIDDQKTFYCPQGHAQHYTGKTEAQKLKEQLEAKQREIDRQAGRAASLERQRDKVVRAYGKMRDRVKNGVCPCCNRTFQNFMEHMKSQHPEFGSHQVLRSMRSMYGLTQASLADEIGASGGQVSLFERGKPCAEYAKRAIESWMVENG